jgi:sigma-B regulation protein RsbU (phosphoserine phosphatase)
MHKVKIDQALLAIPLFASLPKREIEQLSRTLVVQEVQPGVLLLHEDEPGDRYYILLEGEVEVLKALGTSDERLLGVRRANSFIGEMSLFTEDGRHTASVRARTPVRLLEMSHAELDALLHRHPTFAYEIIRTLSRRLDRSENVIIDELRQKNKRLTELLEALEKAQEQIIEKERYEKELEVARAIQMSILPSSLPACPELEFGARIIPMAAVGGDFYDIIQLGEGTFGVAMGDVSDHGVPAALFMALTATLLRVEARRAGNPSEVLRAVNQHLLGMNEAGMFVTLLYGVFDCDERRFDYARAGHELPLLIDPDGDPVPFDREPGQPLGLFEDLLLDEQSRTLSPGSLLMLFTDGVTESFNPDREIFGAESTYQAVVPERDRPAYEICDRLLDVLKSYRGGRVTEDDVTVMAIKIKANGG